MIYGEYKGFGAESLKLDDETLSLRRILAVNANMFRVACQDPALLLRLETPRYDDFVYEAITPHTRDMERIAKGTGLYKGHRIEPELIDIFNGVPELVECEAHYIQYGPDIMDVCRWTDAQIYVIPTDSKLV